MTETNTNFTRRQALYGLGGVSALAMALKRNQTRVAAAAIINTRSPKQTTATSETVSHNQSSLASTVAQASSRPSDDAVPEDSDVSDSSLSDMAE